jgi:hypothetical protein
MGEARLLFCAPKRRLKAALRKLDQLLVSKLPKSEHAHGFVRGRSIATHAKPHVGNETVLRFDIKDCFPSIHFGRVRGLGLSRQERRKLRAALHQQQSKPPSVAVDRRLAGKLAYLNMLNPKQALALRRGAGSAAGQVVRALGSDGGSA